MSEYQGNIVIKNPATPTGPSAYGSAPGMWKLSEVAYWIKQGVWPNPAIIPDQYFPYVSLLLSTTSLGNANNNLFVDSSGAFNPISRSGNATQGSATPYSTNWSNYFDGNADYLTIPTNAAFGYGTADFTIEFWLNLSGVPAAMSVVSNLSSASGTSPHLYIATDGTLRYYTASVDRITSSVVPLQQWIHVALCRSSGSTRMFFNGVQTGSTYSDSNNYGSSNPVGIATYWNGTPVSTNTLFGYLSNLRILNGVGLYTTTFTPPTSPLAAISGTSLLTCQSNRFRDASTNNFTVTSNGDTRVTDYGPFSPSTYAPIAYNQSDITNWSGYFDGTGDYLTAPYTTANFDWYTAGTDFTIEAWFYANTLTNTSYPNGGTQAPVMCGNRDPNAGTDYWSFGPTSEGIVAFYYFSGSAQRVASTTTISAGRWNHAAMTKTSSGITLFVNGTAQTTVAISGTPQSSASFPFAIGQGGSSSYSFPGYISNLRVVRGTAIYSGNFTPPTSPLTAVANTKILTLQNAAFTDNSTNNLVITPNGNVTVTGNSPFNTVGYWSNYFSSTGTDGLNFVSSSQVDVSTGDFTFECWVYFNGFGSDKKYIIQFSGGNYWQLVHDSSFGISLRVTGYSEIVGQGSNSGWTTGQWYHVALVRNGNNWNIYRNGVSIASATNSSSIGYYSPTYIGNYSSGNSINGYMSNVRLVKGTAVYTSNFTPPTAPLTAISGTGLLTCQNGRFIDNSANNFALTATGSISAQSFDPFYTSTIASNGGSMYFDGSGDYLSLPDNPSLQLGSSSFTVEYWWYPVSIAGYQTPFEKGYTGSGAILMQTGNGDGVIYVYASGSAVITASTAVGAGRWNHVALVRNGTSLVLYLNGVSIGSATNSTDFNNTGVMGIGANVSGGGAGAYPINGYMSDVRVTKGTALYTAAFTPPTAPVTPTAATTLLVNGMNAGIYDATAINDMETVGNAQVTTAVSKFGGSSVYFDGTGDWLSVPDQPTSNFGVGDFTLEFWINFNSVSGTIGVVGKRASEANYAPLIMEMSSSALRLYMSTTGSSWQVNGLATGTLSTGTWYHIAVSRSGSTVYMFVNGVSVGSTGTASGALMTNTSPLYIGANSGSPSGAGTLNGYIDDLRVTRGVARYTSNFTPPTQPFPVY